MTPPAAAIRFSPVIFSFSGPRMAGARNVDVPQHMDMHHVSVDISPYLCVLISFFRTSAPCGASPCDIWYWYISPSICNHKPRRAPRISFVCLFLAAVPAPLVAPRKCFHSASREPQPPSVFGAYITLGYIGTYVYSIHLLIALSPCFLWGPPLGVSWHV